MSFGESPVVVPPPARGLLLPLAGLASLLLGGFVVGGEAGQFALAGVQVVPIIVLAALWQLSTRWPGLRGPAWGLFWATLLGFASVALLLMVAAGMDDLAQGLVPGHEGPMLAAIGLVAAALAGATLLIATGRWLPLGGWLGAHIPSRQWWYAQAVVGLLFFVAASLAPLVGLGGEPPLLRLIDQHEGLSQMRSAQGQILDVFYTLAWMIPVALLGAGVPLRRRLLNGLSRLGVGPLHRRDVPVLVLVAAGLVILSLVLDTVLGAVWTWASWPRTDVGAVGQLFESFGSPIGAVSIGISAGIGEELVVRGLLQPRFGWFLPNLAFASAHAFQYGADGLVSVFVIGAVQAGVRARWNTTAAATTHGLYDFMLVMGSTIGVPGF